LAPAAGDGVVLLVTGNEADRPRPVQLADRQTSRIWVPPAGVSRVHGRSSTPVRCMTGPSGPQRQRCWSLGG